MHAFNVYLKTILIYIATFIHKTQYFPVVKINLISTVAEQKKSLEQIELLCIILKNTKHVT